MTPRVMHGYLMLAHRRKLGERVMRIEDARLARSSHQAYEKHLKKIKDEAE